MTFNISATVTLVPTENPKRGGEYTKSRTETEKKKQNLELKKQPKTGDLLELLPPRGAGHGAETTKYSSVSSPPLSKTQKLTVFKERQLIQTKN